MSSSFTMMSSRVKTAKLNSDVLILVFSCTIVLYIFCIVECVASTVGCKSETNVPTMIASSRFYGKSVKINALPFT